MTDRLNRQLEKPGKGGLNRNEEGGHKEKEETTGGREAAEMLLINEIPGKISWCGKKWKLIQTHDEHC